MVTHGGKEGGEGGGGKGAAGGKWMELEQGR